MQKSQKKKKKKDKHTLLAKESAAHMDTQSRIQWRAGIPSEEKPITILLIPYPINPMSESTPDKPLN